MSTVLLATDGSDLATSAIERGLAVLGPGHRLVAIAVAPPDLLPGAVLSPVDALHTTLADPEVEELVRQEHLEECRKDLAALAERLGTDVEQVAVTGEPGEAICDTARDLGADVIVMGSRGRGLVKRVVLGSVSSHVLHHAPCPVLISQS